jgi:hypothetical protein
MKINEQRNEYIQTKIIRPAINLVLYMQLQLPSLKIGLTLMSTFFFVR